MRNILKYFKKTYIIGLLLTIALVASAWTGPSENPPGGNVAKPINTSPQTQTKYGSINFTDWTDSTSGQTGYYVDPGGNSLLNRIYSHDIRVTVEPTEDNQVATKAYVDASGGGGKNTLIDVATTPCDATHELAIGISRETRGQMFCDYDGGSGAGWVSMQSTVFISKFPAGSSQDENTCISDGGEVVAIDATNTICRFSASSCPSGWSQYEDWSTVSGPTAGTRGSECWYSDCKGTRKVCYCNPSRAWSNSTVRTCVYTECVLGYFCGPDGLSGWYGTTCGSDRTSPKADITEIGCY